MADTSVPNYPDILGYITGGERYTLGVAQVALAVRPRVVRAGRPFEVIMLVQNASDSTVDLAFTLYVPERDADKKKGRFVAKTGRLVVAMQAAEVGYVSLPVSCLPDTSSSPDYKIGMEIAAKPLEKAKRIRAADGGGPVEPAHLNPDSAAKLEDLKQLRFSSAKRTTLRGTVLEAGFGVMSGKVGTIPDLKPSWSSLWTLADHHDDRLLLHQYWETLKLKVLPALSRATVYKPLMEQTRKRFAAAGYELNPLEAGAISKLLTLILEYAAPDQASHGSHGYLAAGMYNLQPLLDPKRLADEAPFTLPRWASGLLRAIVRSEQAARFPAQAVAQLLYEDLLYDAAIHAFSLIETTTGEDLGDEAERSAYVEEVLAMLKEKDGLDFAHVYMPLALGGVLVYDRVMMEDEKLGELIAGLRDILNERRAELNSENAPIFAIASKLIDQAMMKYGYRGK